MSFDYIREQWPSSADLLALMSFFDRQGIPKEVLTLQTSTKEHNDRNRNDRNSGEDVQEDSASEKSNDSYLDRVEDGHRPVATLLIRFY